MSTSAFLDGSTRFAYLVAGVDPQPGPAESLKKESEKKKAKEASAAASSVSDRKAPLIVGSCSSPSGLSEDQLYGDYSLIQSAYKNSRKYEDIKNLNESMIGEKVWLRARLHTVRAKGKMSFLFLRRGFWTVQGIIVSDLKGQYDRPREMIQFSGKIPSESIVDVYGVVSKSVQKIEKASQQDVEISVLKLFVVSLANPTLPFQIEDAARAENAKNTSNTNTNNNTNASAEEEKKDKASVSSSSSSSSSNSSGGADTSGKDQKQEDEKKQVDVRVGQDIRLNYRWIDIRTPANHAIFRLQSKVCQYFRQFFIDEDFVEIHTPKIIPGVSEGGASVFRLKYFNRMACLAQSPQQHKQMSVMADLFKVFEIGPVFRAEDSNTHRHLCEFVGLDFEMEIKEHYSEITQILGQLFIYIFKQIHSNCRAELEAIRKQYPFEDLQFLEETLILSFPDAVKLLRANGVSIGDFEDFSTPQEKELGRIVKEKYKTDFYIVDRYPLGARPFYTMPCPDDDRYTNSYDVFLRGEEITSGSQRVHDVSLLKKRAEQCGIPADGIAKYVESFSNGAWPHGGAGIGLERVVMLFLGLDNIRKTCMFPRTPDRCEP